MKFGICTSVANATAARGAGWDYIEDSVPNLLQGLVADDGGWTGGELMRSSPLPNLACNGMVPAALKITGPDADPAALEAYLRTILRRARAIGVEKLVFGSGAARTIPDGFDRGVGERQLADFVRTAACLAADHGVTIVLEHLNRGEGNILTTLSDCVGMARAVDHPNLKVLVDTFHLWAEGEPVDHVREAMPWLAHVHLADLAGRVAPGEGSPPSDYRPLFRLLKAGAYSGTMSVEAVGFEPAMFGRVLEFIKAQWDQA